MSRRWFDKPDVGLLLPRRAESQCPVTFGCCVFIRHFAAADHGDAFMQHHCTTPLTPTLPTLETPCPQFSVICCVFRACRLVKVNRSIGTPTTTNQQQRMSEYIVSARKYRPQTFDTVVGQEHITTTLKNAIRNQHLAHAFLFCGPRGVGKTTCARILAKTINCLTPTEDMEACGVCDICTSFKNNTSFNVFELDAASNNSVDDIRELTNQVRFAPQHGKYKVYIIDEVHMLSASAFNAFLKMLEEPPPYAIFILATTEKHKILPTILSRCQIFEFKRITNHDIVAHLQSIAVKENMVAQEAALHVIAQKSEGCMRDALSMLDRIASFTNGMLTYNGTMEHLNLLDADFYFGLTDNILAQDVAATLLMLDKAMEKGFEGDVVIDGLAEHARNLLLCKDSRMVKLLDVPNEHKPIYFEKANQAPPSFILSALNVLNQCELEYKNTNNKRLHVEMCLIRLCFLLVATAPGGQFSEENGDVKKNSGSVVSVPSVTPANTLERVEVPVSAYTAPAPQPINSVAEPHAQAPVAAAPRPTPVGRKLSKGLLDDLDEEVATAESEQPKELSVTQVLELFEVYKQKLLAENKPSIYAQLSQMRIEVILPDEIHIVTPSHLTNTYALDQRSALLDFYREHTKLMVRITTEIQEDESVIEAQMPKVLSKSEMYEEMVRLNPMLARLKSSLNMTLDY